MINILRRIFRRTPRTLLEVETSIISRTNNLLDL